MQTGDRVHTMQEVKKITPYTNRNIVIEFLRIIMAVLVIGNHTASFEYFENFAPFLGFLKRTAVPTFIMISSYLTSEYFFSKSLTFKPFVISRLKRLYTPVLAWSLVYCLANLMFMAASSRIGGKTLPEYQIVNLPNIAWQLFFGHSISAIGYYFIDLLWLNLFFYVVMTKTVKTNIIVCTALILVSFLVQYSRINYLLFGDMDYRVRFTLGRFIEFVPYFSAGLLLNRYKRYGKQFDPQKALSYCAIIAAYGLGYYFSAVDNPAYGFGYNGFGLFLATVLVLYFSLTLDIFKSERSAAVITGLSQLTLGVFCVHLVIAAVCTVVFRMLHLTGQNMLPVIFLSIVVLSFISSYVIKRILGRYAQNVVV